MNFRLGVTGLEAAQTRPWASTGLARHPQVKHAGGMTPPDPRPDPLEAALDADHRASVTRTAVRVQGQLKPSGKRHGLIEQLLNPGQRTPTTPGEAHGDD